VLLGSLPGKGVWDVVSVRVGAVALSVWMVASCAGDPGSSEFQEIERDGVVRALNTGEHPSQVFITEPLVQVGGPEADGSDAFGSISQVAAVPDGGFLVVDAQGRGSVRRFDSSGNFVLEIGARGEGPGEFNQPYRVLLSGDTVRVWSLVPRRLSAFLLDGTFLRTETVEKQSPGLPLFRIRGGFLDELEWGQTADPRPARAAIVRIANGAVVDTLMGPYPVPEFGWEIVDQATQTGRMVNPPVFSARPPWTLCGESLAWGNPETGEVEFRDIDGALKRVVELPGARRQVTDADRNAYIEAVVEAWGVPSEDVGRMRRETEFSEVAPRLTAVLCSPVGSVWVAGFSPSVPRPMDAVGHEWTVLDPRGRATVRVRFAEGFTLFDLTDTAAYGVRPGEFGVDVVEIYDVSTL
jgi:hypothetical protein